MPGITGIGTLSFFLCVAAAAGERDEKDAPIFLVPHDAPQHAHEESILLQSTVLHAKLVAEDSSEAEGSRRRRRRTNRPSPSGPSPARPSPARPAPAATPTPTPAPNTNLLPSDMQEVLDQHNEFRCMHGVPLMTWDPEIAANAQAWADNGQYAHSDNSQRRSATGEQWGENLAWGYPSRSGLDSTIAWYNEIEFTSPRGLASHFQDTTVPGEAIGHYTQVVWKSSVRLGCGKGKATVQGMLGDYWVCQYGPAGNYGGQFETNVLAPTVDASECGLGGGSGGGSGGSTSGGSGSGGGSGGGSDGGGSSSGGGGNAGPPDYENCVPAGSIGQCQQCTHNVQCAVGFCCPYLKLCVPDSSTGCPPPFAQCVPTCGEWIPDYAADMRNCKPNCANSNFPENWLGSDCTSR